MIKIYGSPRSSAGRCYLMLEELGLPYENVPLDMSKREHKSPEFLKLNPNGKVPCLVDGSYVIWESIAINYYLAEKYKPTLLGTTPEQRGLVHQWSVWALNEFQPPLVEMLIQLVFIPAEKRNMSIVEKAREKLPGYLQVLDQCLAGKTYLVADQFTLADINVGSVANLATGLQVNLASYPAIESWFARIKERPSFKKFAESRK